MNDEQDPPILTAVSSSARQLYLLLRCINFSDKAHVKITPQGIQFSVDDASVMEGVAFLKKDLFTTYTFHAPPQPDPPSSASNSDSEEDIQTTTSTGFPTFQISLPSLLETLQIFGLTDLNNSKPLWARDHAPLTATAFSNNNLLGIHNLCRISYDTVGSPLTITLAETSITTTCNLTTYDAVSADGIPFNRQKLAFKTIMRGSLLYDAMLELSTTAPEKLTLWARMRNGAPFFAVSSSGTLGSARVEFNNETITHPKDHGKGKGKASTDQIQTITRSTENGSVNKDNGDPYDVLETFQLGDRSATLSSSYKFSLFQRAMRAMGVAAKVSVRIDEQGVLSLQFMIEVGAGSESEGGEGAAPAAGKLSFVDFVFVPLIEDEDERGDGDAEEGRRGNEEGMETILMEGDGDVDVDWEGDGLN